MNRRQFLMTGLLMWVAVTATGCGYNTLQSKQQNVRAKFSNVETQLQRRSDLLPNLEAAAKSAGVQEQEVFGRISEARSRLLNATSQAPAGEGGDRSPEQRQQIIEAANSFGGTVGRLLSLQESYPQLRSNENFLRLQDEVAGTENRIATYRQDYNTSVQDYNTTRGSFPNVLFAKMYGFKEEPYFNADPASRQAPRLGDPNSLRQNNS